MKNVPSCIFCGGRLLSGFAELHCSWAESIFWGRAPSFLMFVGGDTAEFEALRPAQRKVALDCAQCGAVVISAEPWTP